MGILGCILAGMMAAAAGETVTIDATFREPSRRPTVLFVTFSNPTERTVSITGSARVDLSGGGDAFWGPFDLERFDPAGPNARPATLRLDPGEVRRVALDLRDLHWARSNSSDWPSQPFGEVVPEGTYVVSLRIREDSVAHVAPAAVQAVFTIAMGAAPSR
jgi:hypothetical protein